MNKTNATVLSLFIAVIAVSMLFFVVPITGAFIVSYIFALVAIFSIAISIHFFRNTEMNTITDLSYINTAATYSIISVFFSVIACLIPLSAVISFVIHFLILAFFTIRIIVSSVGGNYIKTVNQANNQKHEKFKKEKDTYWR